MAIALFGRTQAEYMPHHFYTAEGKKNHPLLCNQGGGEAKIGIEIQFDSGAPAVAVKVRLNL